jgi:signal transduction histidine kinase
MKLKSKFSLWISLLLTLVVLGVGAVGLISEQQHLKQELKQRQAQTVLRLSQICSEALYQQNDLVLLNYFRSLQDEQGFVAAAFLDTNGLVRVHSNSRSRIDAIDSPQERQANTASSVFVQEYVDKARTEIVDLSAPVLFTGARTGTARLFLSKKSLDAVVNDALHRTVKRIALITLAALAVGFLGALWLAGTMVRPIQSLVAGMHQISAGKLDPILIPKRHDELGWMGQELNLTIDKLREAEDMRRNFFSRITHELRSPLMAVEGFISMFLVGDYGSLAPSQRDPLLTMMNHSNRLRRLVDDLLTGAKLEAGREELHLTRTRVDNLVTEAAKLYLPLSREKGVKLVVENPPTPVIAWIDSEKILHVITNLISNAFKFTAQGSVTLRVTDDSKLVNISVEDTGVGIPLAERSKLFHRFYRSPSAKDVKGTGLGLFIVKALVEEHGGEITVDASEAGGARFRIALPKEPKHSV